MDSHRQLHSTRSIERRQQVCFPYSGEALTALHNSRSATELDRLAVITADLSEADIARHARERLGLLDR